MLWSPMEPGDEPICFAWDFFFDIPLQDWLLY